MRNLIDLRIQEFKYSRIERINIIQGSFSKRPLITLMYNVIQGFQKLKKQNYYTCR